MKKYILLIAGCLWISFAVNIDAQSETSGDQYTANFGKYKISSVLAYNRSDVKFPYWGWMNEYSYYEIKDNTVACRAIVYGAEKEDEAGTLLGNTAAYIFENGKLIKKTTVDDIEKQKKSLEAARSKYDWPYGSGDDIGNYMTYSSGTAGQQAFVNFNGKQYGPYMMISGLDVSKDKTKFFGIGGAMGNDDVDYYLFSSNGKKIKLPSMPVGMLVNTDFSHGAVTGFANTNSDDEASAGNMNYHEIYFADGTVRKDVTNLSAGTTAWLDPSGKNILAVGQGIGAYLNGKKVTSNDVGAGSFWCSPDGSRWCYTYNDDTQISHLVFSDGANIRGFIHPQQLVVGSKTYIAWFQYKDKSGGDMLFCTKEL
ncbi:MAG: hypothetical protein M1480_19340 [Bacteroidetes bacterium]|nr:hypothetical protein [Bacteroidota bacterium]